MEIILASASPRRRELMDLMKIPYRVIPSQFEEKREEELPREKQVEKLAYRKAKDVLERTEGDRIVIGCDTIVYKDGKFYGKPKKEEVAKEMLQELKDGFHEVITGLCIFVVQNGRVTEYVSYDTTKIHIKDMTEKEIDGWIATGKALDKAGAYAIQEEFSVFIDRIEGSYFSTIGLPIHQVYEVIKKYS